MIGSRNPESPRGEGRPASAGAAALTLPVDPWRAGPPALRLDARPPVLRAGVEQLVRLRGIAVLGQLAAIATASAIGVALPVVPMLAVVAALVAWNAWTWLRVRSRREADHAEVATQLAVDLGALTLLLYFSGGTANPFVLLFVLHVVISVLLLPAPAAAFGAVLVAACCVLLWRVHLPLELAGGRALPPDVAMLGQGLSFALTAGVTAWFVMRLVASLRSHDRLLDEAARKALRDEAVLRVGALAAGAAHELATPLTTIAVAAEQILHSANTPAIARDAGIVAAQVGACREMIADLMAAAGHARSMGGGRERLDRFLESVAERCRSMHPDARIGTDWRGLGAAPDVYTEQMLRQALLTLLNNAVDASPDDVRFSGRHDGTTLEIAIADRGDGLPDAVLGRLGRAFFTTKPPGKGAGLGVVLATRAVEALGGSLAWRNRAEGGLTVEVSLPLEALTIEGRR